MSDEELNIVTDDENQLFPTLTHYHRYEATSYADLERLADYLRSIVKNDLLVDLGAGLMRVPIALHYALGISAKGIELNKALYLQGRENIENYRKYYHNEKDKAHFDIETLNMNVLDYSFSGKESILFFFNPFSEEIFRTVIHRFLSAYPYKRRVFVILYYAKHEYIDILGQFGLFSEIHRIELSDYENDPDDVIIIYQIG